MCSFVGLQLLPELNSSCHGDDEDHVSSTTCTTSKKVSLHNYVHYYSTPTTVRTVVDVCFELFVCMADSD